MKIQEIAEKVGLDPKEIFDPQSLRGKGRTTRTLLDALSVALEGRTVCVLFGTARCSQNSFMELLHWLNRLDSHDFKYSADHRMIMFANGGSITCRSHYAGANGYLYDEVLIDHFTNEVALEELRRRMKK